MDDITLTLKDADYIANFIRSKIKDLNEAYKDALKEGNRRADMVKGLAESLLPDDPDIQKRIDELEETRRLSVQTLERTYQDKLETYEKILMLVMTGSTK